MNRRTIFLATTTALVASAIGVVGFFALRATDDAPTSVDTALEQRNSGGGVDVVAVLATGDRFQNMDAAAAARVDPGSETGILLTLDTHSGDLGAFDYAAGARLLGDDGLEAAPLRWVTTKDDSHHLEGILVFARQPRNQVTLALRGLGGVPERVFKFPAQP